MRCNHMQFRIYRNNFVHLQRQRNLNGRILIHIRRGNIDNVRRMLAIQSYHLIEMSSIATLLVTLIEEFIDLKNEHNVRIKE